MDGNFDFEEESDTVVLRTFFGFVLGVPIIYFGAYTIFLTIKKLYGNTFETHENTDEFNEGYAMTRESYVDACLDVKTLVKKSEKFREADFPSYPSARSASSDSKTPSSSRMFSVQDRSTDFTSTRDQALARARSAWKNRTCPICLSEFTIGQEICWPSNKKCVHAFHKDCMKGWLMESDECPCCRNAYLDDSNKSTNEKPDIATGSTVDVSNSNGSINWDESSAITLGSQEFSSEESGSESLVSAEEFSDDECPRNEVNTQGDAVTDIETPSYQRPCKSNREFKSYIARLKAERTHLPNLVLDETNGTSSSDADSSEDTNEAPAVGREQGGEEQRISIFFKRENTGCGPERAYYGQLRTVCSRRRAYSR